VSLPHLFISAIMADLRIFSLPFPACFLCVSSMFPRLRMPLNP
jgi:hypothetical protein